MPLKRTPPTTPKENVKSTTNMSSAPCTDTDNESSSNMMYRTRARKRHHDDDSHAYITETKKTLDTLKNQQITIQGTINDILTQNSEIMKSMDFISKQYEEMKGKITKMETERREHLAYIQTLELKVENLERSQKQSCIEIRNLPLQKTESKDDLLKLVKKLGKVTDTHIEEHHIRDLFRLNSDKGGNKSVVIDFSSILLKEKLLTSIKTFNRINKENKLSTVHLQCDGQTKPIFVSECLTQKARQIFYLAREYSKKNAYEFCWTTHGRVFLRRKVGARAHRIDSASDLDRLYTQTEP